jgi:hypothetical protein
MHCDFSHNKRFYNIATHKQAVKPLPQLRPEVRTLPINPDIFSAQLSFPENVATVPPFQPEPAFSADQVSTRSKLISSKADQGLIS